MEWEETAEQVLLLLYLAQLRRTLAVEAVHLLILLELAV
jgi:hypothetical protein